MGNEKMYIPKEIIPGMVEQAKGLKLYVESEYAPLKACMTGNPSALMIPDPDSPEMANLFKGNMPEEALEFMRKYKHQNVADHAPEIAEQMTMESNALADAVRSEGVKLIRNETGHTPESMVNLHTGWGGEPSWTLYGKSGGQVIGHNFVNMHEVTCSSVAELTIREAIAEMFMNHPETGWLTMPPIFPTTEHPNVGPFMAPENKIFEGAVLCGIGVADPSHIDDLTKPRSATNELAVEVLRRMLAPYGWKVETVYFDSRYTYHIDCLMTLLEEGLMAYPKGSLWTELPEFCKDWEVIDINMEDHKRGAENNLVLGDKRMIGPEGPVQFYKDLKDRGWRVVEVPYSTMWDNFGSGLLCSTMYLWRES